VDARHILSVIADSIPAAADRTGSQKYSEGREVDRGMSKERGENEKGGTEKKKRKTSMALVPSQRHPNFHPTALGSRFHSIRLEAEQKGVYRMRGGNGIRNAGGRER